MPVAADIPTWRSRPAGQGFAFTRVQIHNPLQGFNLTLGNATQHQHASTVHKALGLVPVMLCRQGLKVFKAMHIHHLASPSRPVEPCKGVIIRYTAMSLPSTSSDSIRAPNIS